MHEFTKLFFLFFLLMVFVTFLHNPFLNFYDSFVDSIIKKPYFCSIGRFVELISCFAFVEYSYRQMRKYGTSLYISLVLKYSFYFSIIVLLLYIFQLCGLTIIQVSDYKIYRLTGFYVEGGPYGLLYSVLFILSIQFRQPKKVSGLFALLIVLSQSKAGIFCCIVYFMAILLLKIKSSIRYKKYYVITLFLAFCCVIISFFYIGKMYIEKVRNIDELASYVKSNPLDYSSVAGRIPGSFIVTEMLRHHPLLGIGLGNYPILRNSPEYRSFFPPIDLYDAPGLGGIVDIILQFGILGFFLWYMILMKILRRAPNKSILFLFLMPLLCGVQNTFMYPWFLLAIIIAQRKDRFDYNVKIYV